MCEVDEYDELEIETIAATHLFDDIDCDSEQQIDEYGNYGVAAHHYHNSGCSCLTIIFAALSMVLATVLILLMI